MEGSALNDCWIRALIAPVLVTSLAAPAAASGSCEVNPLGVIASIERIEPPDEPVQVRAADGTNRRAVLFECLRPGDTLVLQGRVAGVELFMSGALRRVSPAESPFVIPGGWAQQMAAVSKAFAQWWTLRPRETGAAVVRPRTRSEADQQVTARSALAHAPQQWLLEGEESVVLDWRATQSALWRPDMTVVGRSLAGKSSVQEARNAFYASFNFEQPLVIGQKGTLRILDDRNQVILNVPFSVTAGSELPHREGLDGDYRTWPAEMRTAWAAWALLEGPPEWQIQALSWLYNNRRDVWLAGHLFYRSINGTLGAY
ncbi:MAG: hypothetical protein J5X21_21390 [Candidatus Accumulibacter sp.]|nr:hypothetical protein [Candidatus Accumulibacter conexus]